MFAPALAPALESPRGALRQLGREAQVFAYLDDVFVVIDPRFGEEAVAATRRALQSVGLGLELTKTKAWTPNPNTEVPVGLVERRVARMTCLGSRLPVALFAADPDDDEEEGVALEHRNTPDEALLALQVFWNA